MLTRGDTPVGFAMLRQFGKGRCIAPVVAIDLNAAKALIPHWVAVNTDRFTRVDVAGVYRLRPRRTKSSRSPRMRWDNTKRVDD